MEHEDSEFWKAAILDEINNHEEIFNVFGPPIPRQPGMNVTPTRFLFSQKLVGLEERTQDAKYKQLQGSHNYERFRARLLYVNNKYTSVQSPWEELFAPVVDKTSLRLFLTISAMYHKHLVHLDVVSAYLHATLTGPARYITLWGDEKGTCSLSVVQSNEWGGQCGADLEQALSCIYGTRRLCAYVERQLHLCASAYVCAELFVCRRYHG